MKLIQNDFLDESFYPFVIYFDKYPMHFLVQKSFDLIVAYAEVSILKVVKETLPL